MVEAVGKAALLVDRVQRLVQRNLARAGKQGLGSRRLLVHGPGGREEAGPAIGPLAHGRVGTRVQALEGVGKRGRQFSLQGIEKGARLA